MRSGALLLVGIGIFTAVVACTTNTSSDLVCSSAGGVCLDPSNLAGCAEELDGLPCDNGGVCCTPAVDAGTSSSASSTGSTAAPTDAGTGG